MKRIWIGIFLFGVLACDTSDPNIPHFTLSKDNIISSHQAHWEGWGTSLCWWANRIGYNPVLTQQAADLFFDTNKGLGLNIMRYNIGGGDDPTHHHITRTDSQIPGWMTWSNQMGTYVYDYYADTCQLHVLKAAAKAAGQEAYIEVFSNSPPYFMTKSGCSSGHTSATANNLREDAYDAFAAYLAHVTNYMCKALGFDVKSISPMNEPNTDYWHAGDTKQEGCHFDPGVPQSTLLIALSKALEEKGLSHIVLAACDETNPALQAQEIAAFSPEARKAVERINVHTYNSEGSAQLGALARREGLELWMSETDWHHVSGEEAGEMAAPLWLAEKICQDISALEPSAWVLWQVIDTHVSKDGYKGRQDNGPLHLEHGYWGVAYADHDVSQIFLSQRYYALGQFTRYIRPGATLIKCPQDTSASDSIQNQPISVLAAYQGTPDKLVIVCTNASARSQRITLSLEALGIDSANTQQIRTSGTLATGEHWATSQGPRVRKGRLRPALAPHSVTTFILN